MSFQHGESGVTPPALRLGRGPQNWNSTAERSEEINARRKASQRTCPRGSSLLPWLHLTCREKPAGELERAGPDRKTRPAVLCDTEGRGGNIRDERRTYKDRLGKIQGKMQNLLFRLKTGQLESCTTASRRDKTRVFWLDEAIRWGSALRWDHQKGSHHEDVRLSAQAWPKTSVQM